ncbi:MAG: hypothetical protein CYPHOPRED_002913 [Cyphobasidiales sp. Tagirdzhanova-0007]|nr:MAG: hypothetical protein CYPHOPRED_002913 [Cyphobasidiales sp. Tagirdzhanova-0007]
MLYLYGRHEYLRRQYLMVGLASMLLEIRYARAWPLASERSIHARDSGDDSSKKTKNSGSDYTHYEFLSVPVYIWLLAGTTLIIAGGVGFFFWQKGKREKEEAVQLQYEEREKEAARRKRGIPPDPDEEMFEAERMDSTWQQSMMHSNEASWEERGRDRYYPAANEYDTRSQ